MSGPGDLPLKPGVSLGAVPGFADSLALGLGLTVNRTDRDAPPWQDLLLIQLRSGRATALEDLPREIEIGHRPRASLGPRM